jgi:hypothetical protein
MAESRPEERLRRAFSFDADDLAANRVGQLTARQEATVDAIRASRRQRLALIWGILGLALVPTVILLLVFQNSETIRRQWTMFIPLGVAIVLIAGFILIETIADYRRTHDLRQRRISQIEGIAARSSARHVRYLAHFLEIGPVRFEITPTDQWEAIDEGQPYRVFYIASPPKHTILSIEALGR